MNITDFESPPCPETWAEVLNAIFSRQHELMVKYKEIENLPSAPVPLHTLSGQRVIKDFAWRTVEELAESFEAWEKHEDFNTAELHALEELADSFHFFVELLLFAGISWNQCHNAILVFPDVNRLLRDFPAKPDEVRYARVASYWQVTYKNGVAMNYLRNKPWKQSQVPTDEGRFRESCIATFVALVQCWANIGYTMEELFQFYMRKSEVNKFRQRSNY
jgi:hypothetical protein